MGSTSRALLKQRGEEVEARVCLICNKQEGGGIVFRKSEDGTALAAAGTSTISVNRNMG